MRTTRTGFITLVVFCASTLAIIALEKECIICGQVRVRSELDGRRMFSDEAVLAHLIRSRIRATARPAAGITVLAEVQDSRYWGQSDPVQGRGTTDASADVLDMHQAWAQCDSIFGMPIVLRVGRQEMSFANERLLFGTTHRYYGLMDFVPVFGSHGLVDLSAGLSSTPLKSLRLLFETHLMKPQRGGERSYGTEIDATMYWRSTPALEVSGGGGVFLPGDALAAAVSDKIAYWLYLAGQFDF